MGEGENMNAALESQDGGAETSKLMSWLMQDVHVHIFIHVYVQMHVPVQIY